MAQNNSSSDRGVLGAFASRASDMVPQSEKRERTTGEKNDGSTRVWQ